MNGSRSVDVIARDHAAHAEHRIAWLRLAAVVLFAGAERLWPPGDNNAAFFSVLGVYAVWSLVLLAITVRRPPGPGEGLLVTGIDVLVITVLSALSGGPFSLVRLGYFIIPVTVAFRYQPSLTLIATAVSIAAYVVQPLLDFGPDEANEIGVVALQAGMLAWIGAACTALSATIARRTERIVQLAADREELLDQALDAETRERRALADGLHDGAVQSLLAVRHDIEEAAARDPHDKTLVRADDVLLGVVRELRAAIFELHPHVLDEAGLEAAVRQVAEVAARRAGFELTLELDDLPPRASDRLLFSVARELLTNVVKHAEAHRVTVTLRDVDGERALSVRDDGTGFDGAVLAQRLAQGHIGLASQRVRLESAGGGLEIEPAPGGGTLASARVPA